MANPLPRLLERIEAGDRLTSHYGGTWDGTGACWQVARPGREQVLFHLAEGTVDLRSPDGERLTLRTGMVAWLDPAAALAWSGEAQASEGVRGRGTELRFSLEGWESAAVPVLAKVPAHTAGSCAALVAELRRFRPQRDLRCRSLLALILSDLRRAAEDTPATSGRLLTAEERQRLERYLRKHFTRRIDSAELARELGCARLTLQRLVRRSYGVSARTWILRTRIRFAAALMLREELSVAETARRLGYPDSSLFCRQFKQVCGVSPGAFRRQPTAVAFV